MAIYKFPNLANQTEGSTNQAYYSGLNKPTPVGNMLGNQTAPSGLYKPNLGTNPNTLNKTTPTGQPLYRDALLNAQTGAIPDGMPDYLRNQWQMSQAQEGGPMVAGNAPTRSVLTRDGRRVVMVNEDGSFPTQYHAWGEGVDPTASRTWDGDLGWVTDETNTTQNPDYQDSRRRRRAIAGTVMTAGFLGGTAAAGGFGGGAGATASTVPQGTNLSTYGGMTTGLDGGALALTPSTGVGGAAGLVPAAGAGAGGGGGGTAAGGLFGNGTAGSFLSSPAGRLVGGLASNYLASRNDRNTSAAADRADPYGPYREDAAQRLQRLMQDPSYVQNLPGYQFRQQQGEQGIQRSAANKGYFRSPNMLYDLSKFNSGLAEQAYNQEFTNLARLAGVDINPGTAGNIMQSGNQQSTNMRAGSFNSFLGAGGNVLDWLFSNNDTPTGTA